MSNERRHELEKNELAILLDRVTNAIQPYAKMIAVGVGILFVGTIVWLFYNSQRTGQRSDATLQLIEGAASQDPEVLMEVGQQYPDTVAAAWAKVYQGQLQLSEGIQSLYRDREEAVQLLGDAKQAFQAAISESADTLLNSRAQLGIARAEESLGDFDAAIAAYENVIKVGESDAVIAQAEERIAALRDPETEKFMAWFDDQNFAPADPSLPPSLPGLDSLPDLPDLQLTDLPGGNASEGDDEKSLGNELALPDDAGDPDSGSNNPTETTESAADGTSENDTSESQPSAESDDANAKDTEESKDDE